MTSTSDGRSKTGHSTTYDQLYITLVDLRGQLKNFIEMSQLREETHRLELARLREEMAQRERDHEERLRILEQRRYVEPKSVWTALAFATGMLGIFTAIINVLISVMMK